MFVPRMSARQLLARYPTARDALIGADFLSALRLADGDPDIAASALVLLGNEQAGLTMLGPDPRGPLNLFSASLGCWLTGVDDASLHWRSILGNSNPNHAGYQLMSAVQADSPGSFIFYTTRPEPDPFAGYLKRWFGDRAIVVGHHPSHVDICIGIDTSVEDLTRVLKRNPDFVLTNQLTILPSAIVGLGCPKVANITDIEMFWAARAEDLSAVDVIIAGNSSDLVELSLRAPTALVQRAAALTQFYDNPIQISRQPMNRPIDLLTTGNIDAPFYPDKQARLMSLANMPATFDIRFSGRVYDPATYASLIRQAKFVVTSSRAVHATLGRQIDAVISGSLVLAPEHAALPLLLNYAQCGVVNYRDRADVGAALANHAHHRNVFDRNIIPLQHAFNQVYPAGAAGSRRLIRYLHVLSWMARLNIRWADIVRGEPVQTRKRDHPAPKGVAVARFVDLIGYRGPHRAAILRSAVRTTADNPPTMPYVGERVAAIAYEAVSDAQSHLVKLQGAGRLRARGRVLQALNAGRKAQPRSLAIWFEIGRFLYESGRYHHAERVLDLIDRNADALQMDDRPLIFESSYEFNDFYFVDSLIRDRIARDSQTDAASPSLPSSALAARVLLARAAAMTAHLAVRRGDLEYGRDRLRRSRLLSSTDPIVIEQSFLVACGISAQSGDVHDTRQAILAYARGARHAFQVSFRYIPTAINLTASLGNSRLADLMLRRWLRAKARIRLSKDEQGLTEDERSMVESHHGIICRIVRDNANTPLGEAMSAVVSAPLGERKSA